jgi:hypothetical protein
MMFAGVQSWAEAVMGNDIADTMNAVENATARMEFRLAMTTHPKK